MFGEPITPANFLAACNAAIDLARIECSTQTAVAIVFEAKGVEVQVTETDSAEVQLALWERKLLKSIEPSSMTAEAKSAFVDGEVLGQDADGGLIQWNGTSGAPYNSGETVEEFGVSNLSEAEVKRMNLSNYIEHPASGKTGTFSARYDLHAERNGQTFTVLGAVDPKTFDATECGEMFSIRFADGVQIDAWPEEVESAIKPGITDNIASSEPIKEIRLIVDVSYLDCKVSARELIGMLNNAVQKRLMVDELACGGKVFGFSTNYLHQRSSMNDTPHIRAMALEQAAEELLIDVNAEQPKQAPRPR